MTSHIPSTALSGSVSSETALPVRCPGEVFIGSVVILFVYGYMSAVVVGLTAELEVQGACERVVSRTNRSVKLQPSTRT